jgi:hypothetical protein
MEKKINNKMQIEEQRKERFDVVSTKYEQWLEIILNLIIQHINDRILTNIFSSDFNKSLNHIMKHSYKKRERLFWNIFEKYSKSNMGSDEEFSRQISKHENILRQLFEKKEKMMEELQAVRILNSEALF